MKLNSISLAAAIVLIVAFRGESAECVRLTDATSLLFASVDTGQAALRTPDKYTEALSRFD
ncbi:MAG: hypothetical protein WD070_09750, partial [Pirellulaceae bacterium]